MPSPENRFDRLVRLSRRAAEEAPAGPMPAALATRVLAHVRAGVRESASPWEWLSFRAVPVAGLAAAICVLYFGGGRLRAPADELGLAEAFVEQQLLP